MVTSEQLKEAMQRRASRQAAPQLDGTRTASVAAIFAPRDDTSDSLEVLFIRRAINPRDRWSGHIAFPGGRVETGELPLDAARRETMEEVGVDLTHAEVLGQLDDRHATRNGLVVSTFVFFLSTKPSTMVLQPHEVSDAVWIPYSELVSVPPSALHYPVGTFLGRFVPRFMRAALAAIPLGSVTFPCVYLPHPSTDARRTDRQAHEYVLWGVTYSMFLDLQALLACDEGRVVRSAKPSFAALYHRAALVVVAFAAVAAHARSSTAP